MPYTCSLCKGKYCGEHRLAESHECIYKGTYNSPDYSKVKRNKDRELRRVKAGLNPDSGENKSYTRSTSSLRAMWEADTKEKTAFLGGMILGLAVTLGYLLSLSVSGLILSVSVMLVGGVGFLFVLKSRQQKALQVGVFTTFVIWPAGIAITLITSLIGFRIYAFGYFTNDGGSLLAEAEVAKRSIYSFAFLYIFLRIVSVVITSLNLSPFLQIVTFMASTMFLWFGLIMMIPWGMLDGSKLYYADSRAYWFHLGGMVILLISSFIL